MLKIERKRKPKSVCRELLKLEQPFFPSAYSEHSETVGFVRAFEKYLRKIYHSCLRSELEERRAFSVDLKELLNDEDVKTAVPELPCLLMNSPEGVINCLGLAMHQVRLDSV